MSETPGEAYVIGTKVTIYSMVKREKEIQFIEKGTGEIVQNSLFCVRVSYIIDDVQSLGWFDNGTRKRMGDHIDPLVFKLPDAPLVALKANDDEE